jgi:hypothetical protein
VIPFKGQQKPSDLHSYWDALPATPFDEDDTPQAVGAFGTSLMKEFKINPAEINIPSDSVAKQSVIGWIIESAVLSEYFVYTLDEAKHGNNDPVVPVEYNNRAINVARHRIAIAGYRLAAILNSKIH